MSKAAEMSRLTTIVAFLLSMFTTCSSAVYRASATVRRLIDVNSTLVFAHASNVWVKSQWVHPNRALDTGVIGEICAFRSLQITMAETPRRENLCRSAFWHGGMWYLWYPWSWHSIPYSDMTFSVFTAGSCAGISTIKRGILSQLSADISASIRCLRECNIDGTLSAVAFYCCRSLRVLSFVFLRNQLEGNTCRIL